MVLGKMPPRKIAPTLTLTLTQVEICREVAQSSGGGRQFSGHVYL